MPNKIPKNSSVFTLFVFVIALIIAEAGVFFDGKVISPQSDSETIVNNAAVRSTHVQHAKGELVIPESSEISQQHNDLKSSLAELR